MALIGAGLMAAGAVSQGAASSQAANYSAQVAYNNAATARRNAQYAASASSAQVTQEGLKAAQRNAGVRVAAAANNLDVNTGSPASVEESQKQLGALDVATVASRGAEQVYGYETQATDFQAQGALDRSQARYDLVGGVLKGAGALAGNPSVDALANPGASAPALPGTEAEGPDASLLNGPPRVPQNYAWANAGNAFLPDEEFGGP